MEIAIASDHAGFEMKQVIRDYLQEKGHNMIDLGADSGEEQVDFPDFAKKLTKEVIDGDILGIGICGTGIGMCMAVNKVKGIRGALIYNNDSAVLAKQHNNANVICVGGRTMDTEEVEEMLDIFLEAKFLGGKYGERNEKIESMRR